MVDDRDAWEKHQEAERAAKQSEARSSSSEWRSNWNQYPPTASTVENAQSEPVTLTEESPDNDGEREGKDVKEKRSWTSLRKGPFALTGLTLVTLFAGIVSFFMSRLFESYAASGLVLAIAMFLALAAVGLSLWAGVDSLFKLSKWDDQRTSYIASALISSGAFLLGLAFGILAFGVAIVSFFMSFFG